MVFKYLNIIIDVIFIMKDEICLLVINVTLAWNFEAILIVLMFLFSGFLFGVFDGHGGPECSQVVSKRLFDYIAASLLPRAELRRIISEFEEGRMVKLTKVFNDTTEFIPELQRIYDSSFLKWCNHLLNDSVSDFSMDDALTSSFLQLDNDISNEVLENKNSPIYPTLLSVALSGSVACIAHIDGPHVHIANTGDCGALIGEVAEESHGGWVVNRLTKDHNWENLTEVKRILSEHPESEKDTIIFNQRLLGTLMPFRAFGDVRFKWDRALQMEIFQSVSAIDMSFLRNCHTPPYLTAKPEVSYHRLKPQEKFMILASDGLWESMNALDIVNLVGEYMSGRQTLQPVRLPRRNVSLGEVSRLLKKRQDGLRLKPSDTNASTHLIRHCIGGTDEGVDHLRLSHSLTLSPDVRRYFRDDISIHVIFFDTNFLRVCPVEL
ncbi:[Pyruvate dehydrogenase [acetyl-transferring]]-phosphatase 1, mitochondrial [Armadillidium vulgare]|nr:[Pyruvate dehydrogenase [acetyl-transferring]]-phosphatase 1, mitochondrial [Armadillidium vulgare]